MVCRLAVGATRAASGVKRLAERQLPAGRSAGFQPAYTTEVHSPSHTTFHVSARLGTTQLMPRHYFLKTLNDATTRTRGYLPHWELPGATYSVTFRLHGSLPHAVVQHLNDERRRIARAITGGVRPMTGIEEMNLRVAMETRFDDELHTHPAVAHLKHPEIANMVAETLTYFENQRYRLDAGSIMPNHVHTVLAPFEPYRLAGIIHS